MSGKDEAVLFLYGPVCYALRTGAVRGARSVSNVLDTPWDPVMVGSERGAPTVPEVYGVCERKHVCMTCYVIKGKELLNRNCKSQHRGTIIECCQLLFGRQPTRQVTLEPK